MMQDLGSSFSTMSDSRFSYGMESFIYRLGQRCRIRTRIISVLDMPYDFKSDGRALAEAMERTSDLLFAESRIPTRVSIIVDRCARSTRTVGSLAARAAKNAMIASNIFVQGRRTEKGGPHAKKTYTHSVAHSASRRGELVPRDDIKVERFRASIELGIAQLADDLETTVVRSP